MTSAIIDVLVPAYNAEKTIESSLNSILAQTVADVRVIVVDDGSIDRTGELLAAIQARDPRLEVVTVPNGGIVSALNIALAHSDAEFIARHDADDIAYPHRFERQIAYLKKHPDCIGIGCNAVIIDEYDRETRRSGYGGDVTGDAARIPAREPYILHPFLMMRATALKAAAGYRYVLHAEDTDLYWRLLTHGRLYDLGEFLGCYRIHTNSLTSASVHNGRVGSVYATLAAVSHQRRLAGKADLVFPAEAVTHVKGIATTPEIIAYAGQDLTPAELAYVRTASAAKLLQNATYRRYLLERGDCEFIQGEMDAIRHGTNDPLWKEIELDRAKVLARLVRRGRFAEARALRSSVRDYALLLRVGVRRAKSLIRRGSHAR